MKELENINEINNKKVILDFYSSSCVPCRRVIKMLENEPNLDVLKVNVEKSENAFIINKFGIQAVPTLVLLNNNSEVTRANGIIGVNAIKEAWEKLD